MDFKRYTLDNGLRVMALKKPEQPLVTFRLFVKCGSRRDNGKRGIAHLLEHMIFRSFQTGMEEDIYSRIEALGGKVEGNTTKEYSDYSLAILKESYIKGLQLFSEMICSPRFSAAGIEAERKIIAEEIVNSYSRLQILWNCYAQTMWQDSPLCDPILGTIESINTITLEDLMDFYSRYYCASNSVLVVIGDIDYSEIEETVSRMFSAMPQGDCLPEPVQAPHILNEKRDAHIEKNALQSHLVVGYPGVGLTHKDLSAFRLLNKIIGNGLSSRLYRLLKVNLHLVYSVSSTLAIYEDTGYFAVWTTFNNRKTDTIIHSINGEITRLKQTGINPDELDRAKIRYKRDLLANYESTHALAGFIGTSLILTRKFRSLHQVIMDIDDVDRDDLYAIAVNYFSEENRYTVSIGKR